MDFHAAAEQYFSLLEQAGLPEVDREPLVTAYGRYAEAVQAVWPPAELQAGAADAFARYASEAKAAWAEDGRAERADEAYAAYVRALREAWSSAEPDSVGPVELASIAQGMTTVAWTAALCAKGDGG
jgi:hypothetical protein